MYQSNPQLGNSRRKSLIGKVATKAMARKGYTGGVSKFGKLANAGKQTRGLRPFRGSNANRSTARPGGYSDFLDGLTGGVRSGEGWVSSDPRSVNTAPVQAPLPDSYVNPVDNALNPQQADQQAAVPVGTPGAVPGTFNAGTPNAPIYTDVGGALSNPNNPASVTSTGSVFEGALPGYSSANQGLDPAIANAIANHQAPALSQAGPSAPISAPGGLIPLGGGRYYDPATDTIRGGGGRGGI
jgi:hypothetical protein